MDRNATSAIATFFLVAGILLGVNFMVAREPDNGWLAWMLLFLAAAAFIWWWMRRDDLARKNAEDAAKQAIKDAEQGFGKIAEKVEPRKASVEAKPEASPSAKVAEPKAEAPAAPAPKAEAPAAAAPEPKAEPAPEPAAQPQPEARSEAKPEPEPEPEAEETLTAAVESSKDDVEAIKGEPSNEPDDLTRVEGIGPKYRDVLIASGIDTFAKLAKLSQTEIEALASAGGVRRSASMVSWAEQAALAAKGDWDALAKLQESLTAGRKD